STARQRRKPKPSHSPSRWCATVRCHPPRRPRGGGEKKGAESRRSAPSGRVKFDGSKSGQSAIAFLGKAWRPRVRRTKRRRFLDCSLRPSILLTPTCGEATRSRCCGRAC